MAMTKCWECRFWAGTPTRGDSGIGDCRIRAPTAGPKKDLHEAVWPWAKEFEGCGEGQPRDAETPPKPKPEGR